MWKAGRLHVRDRNAVRAVKLSTALGRVLLGAALCVVSAPIAAPAWADNPKQPPGKLTRPPTLTRFVEAEYPVAERAARQTGSVTMRLSISARGEVEAAEVVTSAGKAFDDAAVAAARRFAFEPAEVDGKPAPVTIVYRYDFTLQPALPSHGQMSGIVRDRDSKAPKSGVRVELDTGESIVTDAAGKFVFDAVAPGTRKISITAPGLTTVQTEETFEVGKRIEATYDLDPPAAAGSPEESDDLEVVITAPPLAKQVTSVKVASEEARRVPGSQGDIVRVVQNLPGVNRAAAGSGDLVVWGAAPEDTRAYVDGIHIPQLYHFGGLRSVVGSDLVRSVELTPGGYGASYGRGLGGLVTIQSLELEEGFHGSVAMDFFDVAATVRGGNERFRGAGGFRYGFLHRLVPIVTSADVGELFPIPEYLDGQLKAAVFTSPSTSFELGGYASSDRLERIVSSPDPSARRSDERSLAWGRVYGRFKTSSEDGSEVTITPWVGLDRSSRTQRFGAIATSVSDESWLMGLRGLYRARVIPESDGALSGLSLTVGFDGEARRATLQRNGSIGAPRREGDETVFGEAPADQIASDSWEVWVGSPALHGEVDLSLAGGALHLTPGARIEPAFSSVSRRTPAVGDTPSVGAFEQELFLEPRLGARLQVGPSVEVRAAYGLYHQPPAPEDLSAVFGNPLLESSSAHHVLGGIRAKLPWLLSADVVGFYTTSNDLPVRSRRPSPALTKALVQVGSGRSYGVQLLLRRERGDGFFGWISYALSRSERADSEDGRFRPSDYDQTHVLTALASYEIWGGIEIGARFRVASGSPRTPVVGSYFDATADAYRPVFGVTNGTRLPPFIQLDARASKRFDIGSLDLEVYLDVQNVTNHENVEEVIYSSDYTQSGEITGLPILPVLGVRSSW